jgi:protein TonB
MTRLAEFAVAGIAALGLHLAAFAALGSSVPSGATSAGAGGTELVSVAPSDAMLSDLIARWETPPSLTPPPMPEPPPQITDTPPQITEAPPPLPDVTPAPEMAPIAMADALPQVAAPPKPPEPPAEPVAKAPEPPPDPAPEPKPEPEPAAKPTPAPRPAQPAQLAEGSGNKGAAGTEGTAQAATQSDAQTADLRAGWGADIRARIERRKAYPRDGDGASGTVKLRLTVGSDGRLAAVQIVASSGSDALDAAAIKAVQRAGRLPKAPRGLGAGQVTFTLPISFKP